jgi:hypothetical protein
VNGLDVGDRSSGVPIWNQNNIYQMCSLYFGSQLMLDLQWGKSVQASTGKKLMSADSLPGNHDQILSVDSMFIVAQFQ